MCDKNVRPHTVQLSGRTLYSSNRHSSQSRSYGETAMIQYNYWIKDRSLANTRLAPYLIMDKSSFFHILGKHMRHTILCYANRPQADAMEM